VEAQEKVSRIFFRRSAAHEFTAKEIETDWLDRVKASKPSRAKATDGQKKMKRPQDVEESILLRLTNGEQEAGFEDAD
jgi:hypothetical protein